MFKIIRYLKGHGLAVLAIVALLVVQANCDLALPQYMADIVNIGIQQNGIAEVAPDEMRRQTLDNLGLFMTEDELAAVEAAYAENEAGNLVLISKDRETLDALNAILSPPIIALSQLEDIDRNPMIAAMRMAVQMGMMTEEQAAMLTARLAEAGDVAPLTQEAVVAALVSVGVNEEMIAGMAGAVSPDEAQAGALAQLVKMQVLTQQEAFALLETARALGSVPDALRALLADGQIAADQLIAMRGVILDGLGIQAESLASQSAILFVRAEYEALGIDLGGVQSAYLLASGAKMLGVTAVMVAAAVLVGMLAARVSAKIGVDLRGRIFRRVVAFSSGDMDRFSAASLITRSTNDVQQVQTVAVMLLRMVLYAPILGIGGVIKVMSTRTGLGWIVFAAVATLLVIVALLIFVAMPKFQLMQKLIDRMNLVSREILTGLQVIRAFSREAHEDGRFAVANGDLMRTQLFTSRVMTLMMPVMTLIMNIVMIMIYWFGAQGADAGNLQYGDVIAFSTYTMQIVMSFLMLAMIAVFLPRAAVSAGRIEEVLSTEPSIADKEDSDDGEGRAYRGVVAFENASFRYPGAKEDVIEHVTFTARPGQTTAIIGSTGSGKSTLLNLIPRFFDVSDGRVTLDGVDIRDISQHALREQIGYVPQKGVLFSGTIESNLKYGGDAISDEDMQWAASIAQAADFIGEKPDGYQEPVAQDGTNVSGGQRQRLSIARAIAKRPKVLLFDDSFSALDYKTDITLRRALSQSIREATVIIVAQRISTVLHADQIVVLSEGKMVGRGTHRELMQSCDVYREIAGSQLSEAELKGGVGA